ncbi:cytochrome c biogenesis protein CcdA [Clostridium sp. FP2]|uniref:cytochrome c biogenesis CcdA family protein n=1 Tax=Clostridium TaxID=1485 RepID=UPI0013E95ECF|nr:MULTISPECIES: cytochrome c biogenesis protein CcdA [Clostridium]MBW9157905.1 cytochrome c biogenesis protein CcdA [Clostridium tagluense]MBZ9622811.1 cytochrome c biogenesis protein CcdA [Clostridium sp. FP2]WLC67102.1 cytochrome c biogenesis protein CcdA [Clostridium tagluense]
MNNISLILAFSAGLLSFLSPCVLPLVPAYISYLTGTAVNELDDKKAKLNILYKSFGFVIGFSIIFILMGASITTLGKIFISNQTIFRKISGLLMIVFGLHTIGLLKIKLLYREKRFFSFNKASGKFGSILMGMAFAAGWTPCIGPILSSILMYASSSETIGKGILLLSVYSLGLAVPFILTALAIGSFTKHKNAIFKYLPVISAISGILLLLMGILIFTNKVNILSRYLDFFNF